MDNPQLNTKATNAFSEIQIGDDTSYDNYYKANYYSIDIAVGDVDRKLNENGEYNDEIVVAFHMYDPYMGQVLCVAVLDKDLKLMGYRWANGTPDYPTEYNGYTRPHFSVTMGDYDNDGLCEIAVGFRTADSHGGNQKYEIDTFQYEEGYLSPPHWYVCELDLIGNDQYNVVDLTSGDFNGDGIDEIAVAISSFQVGDAADYSNLVPYLYIFSTDKDLILEYRGGWHPGDIYDNGDAGKIVNY